MFAKAIIDTDRFMDLSISAKAIYFLLGMEADDEGFVSYKKVMRIHGGNEDDVKVLVAKKFLLAFDSGVVVITDWNSNNYLNKNRIKETEYQKEKKQLLLTDKGKYEFNNGLTSIEESSIEEKSIVPVAEATVKEYNFEEELQKLKNSTRKDYKIIALYWKKKGFVFENKEQFNAALVRELKAAKLLKGYSGEQIGQAIKFCMKEYPLWTLETCGKRISDIINKK